MTSQKHGVSALGLQRLLGLGSYQTAWTILQKLRTAMVRPERDRLRGSVEVDETCVGGIEHGVRGRGAGQSVHQNHPMRLTPNQGMRNPDQNRACISAKNQRRQT